MGRHPHDEARAISAIRAIAGREAGSDQAVLLAVREVAAWSRLAILAELKQKRTVLQRAQMVGRPFPVLTVTGAAELELPWSNYLYAMLGGPPGTWEARGNRFAEVLLAALVQPQAPQCLTEQDLLQQAEAWSGDVTIHREIGLGQVACDCRHSCCLDLALVGGGHAVAIEHKVKAGASNWRCGSCGGVQADWYVKLFPRQIERWREDGHGDLAGHYVYLSPTGRAPSQWTAWTHRDTAAVLTRVVADPLWRANARFGERYQAIAFLLDLKASVAGDDRALWDGVERWLGAPDDVSAALALHAALDRDPDALTLMEALDAPDHG